MDRAISHLQKKKDEKTTFRIILLDIRSTKSCCLNIIRLLLFILINTSFRALWCWLLIPKQYLLQVVFSPSFRGSRLEENDEEKDKSYTALLFFPFLVIFSASIPYWLDLPYKFWLPLTKSSYDRCSLLLLLLYYVWDGKKRRKNVNKEGRWNCWRIGNPMLVKQMSMSIPLSTFVHSNSLKDHNLWG